jgi:DNA end-binding protein Ku
MALQLVGQMKQEWQPEAFHDSYRDDLMKRIQQKIRAGETHELTEKQEAETPAKSAKVVDLTALLRQSLEAKRKGAAASGAAGTRAKTRSRSTRRHSTSRGQRSRA